MHIKSNRTYSKQHVLGIFHTCETRLWENRNKVLTLLFLFDTCVCGMTHICEQCIKHMFHQRTCDNFAGGLPMHVLMLFDVWILAVL